MRAFKLVHNETAFGCPRTFSNTQDYLILPEVYRRMHQQTYQEARYDLRRHDLGWDSCPPSWASSAEWKRRNPGVRV